MDNSKLPNEKGMAGDAKKNRQTRPDAAIQSEDAAASRARAAMDKDSSINLVVQNPNADAFTIDLGNVVHNMKVLKRVYAWVLLLCMVVGVCVPLLMYQLKDDPYTVYSAVTLKYMVDNIYDDDTTDQDVQDVPERVMVRDLTAPDGEPLDLGQITSAYVLQNALNAVELSEPVTLSELSRNITVTRILSEDSMREQEILNSMIENKSADAYKTMASMEYTYSNTFFVSLKNGFGDEESKRTVNLKNSELEVLLDQIMTEYNAYLVKTYADVKLPDDAISVIDMDILDIPESIEQLRSALNSLYAYCSEKPEDVRAYRSWQTGYSLNDIMDRIQMVQEVDLEYLSSYVYANGIARDRAEVIDNQNYDLMMAQTDLARINDDIASTALLLDNYKNDEIFVSSPDSEYAQTAITNTTYYNNLILAQADNEKQAAQKETQITELRARIAALKNADGIVTQAQIDEAAAELDNLFEICSTLNDFIRSHMTEVFASSFYNELAEHSAAIGSRQNFLSANMKNMVIGAVAGAIIGCVIWFFAGIGVEFSKRREREEQRIKAMQEKEVQA